MATYDLLNCKNFKVDPVFFFYCAFKLTFVTQISGDEDSEYFDRSAEISEIDERLDRLQQLMKATMP